MATKKKRKKKTATKKTYAPKSGQKPGVANARKYPDGRYRSKVKKSNGKGWTTRAVKASSVKKAKAAKK